jgi:hypothetical protein
MIDKDVLTDLYYTQRLSMTQIAERVSCSLSQVIYWMDKYGLARRSRSEAVYARVHPDGDSFSIKPLKTDRARALFNLAVGLYIGEGSKSRANEVTLTSVNPQIQRIFVRFLREICGVDSVDLVVRVLTYADADCGVVKRYWSEALAVSPQQVRIFVKSAHSRSQRAFASRYYGTAQVSLYNTVLARQVLAWCENALTKFGEPGYNPPRLPA